MKKKKEIKKEKENFSLTAFEEKEKEEKVKNRKMLLQKINIGMIALITVGVITYFLTKNAYNTLIYSIGTFVIIEGYFLISAKIKSSLDTKKMEEIFPDFIELMASNLRAGMTIDKALILSSRKEFSPLDKEISILGKDLITGKEITRAMLDLAKRTRSEKILKTINIINSGIKSGGNISILLEETAVNMRERNFVEKRASSNVLMYVIFIFFAVAVGAPVLFGLSSVLVEVLSAILSEIPQIEAENVNLPLTLSGISISINFVVYFSLVFVIATDILASLLLGLVNKGEEKAGLKYILPLILIGLISFFSVRLTLLKYFSNLIG